MSTAMENALRRIAMVIAPADVPEVVLGIEKAVRHSARHRPQITFTEGLISADEMRRRAAWCVEWVLDAKKATKWPTERLVDELPQRLVDFIDGIERPLDTSMAAWAGPARPGTEGDWQ